MPEICYKDMKYIRLKTTDPHLNLAVEEYLFRSSEDDIFMLWQNEPTVVVGKNQNAYAEVNTEYAKEHGINIVRRITGGGAVYHDLGNLNYTFITSDSKAKALDYEYFTRPIIDALATLGVVATLSGRNDLEVDGKKFSGNAQFCSEGRILHHGTLLFNTDVNEMSAVLRVDKEKLEYKAVKSHKSRVANLCNIIENDIDLDGFIALIENFVIKSMEAETTPPPSNDEINGLAERNRSYEWIFSDKRYLTSYTVTRRKKYPFGIVNLEMKLDGDIIEDIVISGDFFEGESVVELEALLKSRRLSSLDDIDVSHYIDKMTTEELSKLISKE